MELETKVILSKNDLDTLVIEYLNLKGFKVDKIKYDINEYSHENDYYDEYGTIPKLDSVICNVSKEE